jgi:enoyl-CoA hydratase/carnithine racemase
MFVCSKRVERDGRLVCFKGQTMTEAEAEALGLLETAEPEPQTEADAPKKGRKTKKAE